MHTDICMYNYAYIIYFLDVLLKKKRNIHVCLYIMYIHCIHIIRSKNKWQVRERKNDVGTSEQVSFLEKDKKEKRSNGELNHWGNRILYLKRDNHIPLHSFE